MAAETVSVETITAIANINPIELMIARPFLLERFLETKVNVRKCHSPETLRIPPCDLQNQKSLTMSFKDHRTKPKTD